MGRQGTSVTRNAEVEMETGYVTTNSQGQRNKYVFLMFIFVSVLVLSSISMAQSSQEARGLYQRGRQRYTRGDFDGAIADYTRAILLTTRIQASQKDRDDNGKLK